LKERAGDVLKLVLEEPDILGLNDGPSDIDNDSMLIYLPLITEKLNAC